jgi:hypothetical protein
LHIFAKKLKMKKLFVAILYLFSYTVMYSQNRDLLIDHAELLNNTGFFSSKTDTQIVNGEKQLIFEFSAVTEEYIIRVYPADKYKSYKFEFNSTSDYEVVDSVFFINDSYYQTRLRFKKIIDNPQLSILVTAISPEGRTLISEIKLFPVAVMDFGFVKKPEDMFIGEESFIDLYTNLPSNIVLSGSWNTEYPLNTRIVNNKGNVAVNVNATQTGNMNVPVSLKLKRPIRDSLSNLKYELGPLELDFNVKSSRLAFLNTDIKDVSIDEKNRYDGVEIQIDNHSQLQMQKTYRIENTEEAGGVLIAELFTKTRLTNNKVLCVLRTYNYHSQTEGFLYLKDGDIAKFITNFSVIPLTKIESVKVMRQGGTWIESNVVYPGEEILVRIEGQSLSKAKYSIEDLLISTGDTLANRNDVIELKAKVPIDVRKKNPAILINNQPSGKSLNIAEYEIIRPLDYIMIDYGNGSKNLLDYTGPEFTPNSIKDIVITFDNDKIDSNGILHGNQYFDLEVKVTGSKGEILEVLNLPSNMVVPSATSPRWPYYNKKNAVTTIILNQYLNRKTFDLDNWVRIQLVFKPTKSSSARSETKTVDIIVQKSTRFDIDVSFPAGLITKKVGDPGYGDLGGISLAMIAQFSFYQKDKIARFRPYKIGAGFIAINALNFADNNAVRDMGVVIIGSLYPTTKESKMTFPLYLGGGYLLATEKWFFLIGPGIRVRL